MRSSSSLLAAGSLLAVLVPGTARAEELALNFDPPAIAADHRPDPGQSIPQLESEIPPQTEGIAPLPVPTQAGNPPMRYHSPQQLPRSVYRGAIAVALTSDGPPASVLPPAPPSPDPAPVQVAVLPIATQAIPATAMADTTTKTPAEAEPTSLALSFDLASPPLTSQPLIDLAIASPAPSNTDWIGDLFTGNSNSLVARAVGSAEGTRTPTGDRRAAYYGHVDPGNRAWNLGTFSYQHGAASPTEADARQLRRLRTQTQILEARATQLGLSLSLEETLNGIDLANQSPLAAIGRVGYVERLAEARAMGHNGIDAIVVARTRSYINPKTKQWNAPGLGNTQASINRDQERRAKAVSHALVAYQRENPGFDSSAAILGKPLISPTPGEGSSGFISSEPSPDSQAFILAFDPEQLYLPTPKGASVDVSPSPSQSPGLTSKASGDLTVAELSRPDSSQPVPQAPPTSPGLREEVREANQTLTPLPSAIVASAPTPEALATVSGADSSNSPSPPQIPLENHRSSLPWLLNEPGAIPQTVIHSPAVETEAAVVQALNPKEEIPKEHIKAPEDNGATPPSLEPIVSQGPEI
ncbi:MAG: hypothetical protein ACOYMP_01215 [Nodosilinea sp.]